MESVGPGGWRDLKIRGDAYFLSAAGDVDRRTSVVVPVGFTRRADQVTLYLQDLDLPELRATADELTAPAHAPRQRQ